MNQYKLKNSAPLPKISSGLKFGSSGSVILTLIAAISTQNWELALMVFGVSILPVLVQFIIAYAKTDPRLAEAMQLLDEVELKQKGTSE